MAEDLLRPQVVRPRGLPPKRLVITLFVMLCLIVLVIAFFSSSPAGPATADDIARRNAARLTDQDRNTIGSATADVREAADRSGWPAQFRARPTEPAPAAPLPSPPALPAEPMPVHAASLRGAVPSEPDPGEAARQLEVMNSRIVILDVDEAPRPDVAAPSARPTPPEPGAVHPAAVASAAGSTGEAAKAIAAALAAEANGTAPSPAPPARQFRAEMAGIHSPPALRPQAPAGRYLVMEGTVLPAALLRDIVSDLPGVITAVVSQDIHDSVSARHLLICKGARLVGQYSSDVVAGQSRLLFAFTRLILPDGSSFDLAGFDGSDMAGRAGVDGDVDNHFLRIYGSALLTGLLADRVTRPAAVPGGQFAQPSATGQVMIDSAREMLRRHQRLAPTITVRSGTRLHVEVRRDLAFASPADGRCV